MRDQLLQTKVTSEEYERIAEAAKRRGLTLAAFLRDAAAGRAEAPLAAWLVDYGAHAASLTVSPLRADFLLLPAGTELGGQRSFLVMTLSAREQLVALHPGAAVNLLDPDHVARKQFTLYGSYVPWFLASTRATTSAGFEILEITLRPDGSSPRDLIRRRIYIASGGWLRYDLASGRSIVGRADIATLGADTCELQLDDGGKITLMYDRVDSISAAAVA